MLEQKRTSGSQIFPAPAEIFPAPADGAVIEETPPVFSFLRDGKEKKYRVVVQDRSGKIVFEAETEKNHVVPREPLKPGKYRWNLLCGEEERGWQEFVISENAAVILRKDAETVFCAVPDVVILRKDAETVFCAVPDVRPRHLFFKEDIPGILKKRKAETEVLKRNIEAACARELPKPPLFYSFEDGLPYREYFGEYREYCDRDMVACALGYALLGDEGAGKKAKELLLTIWLGYALLGDEGAGKKAKELLLTICSWNPDGPCAVNAPWNDEIGLSNARCIPAVYDMLYDILTDQQRYIAEKTIIVYDMLYDILTDQQRYIAEKTIIAYAEQCEERLRALDFAENPGDSHAGRLPAYLGEAALVLKGSTYIKEEILIRWLSYALEIYGGIFPFYGTADGGWAEGPFYASSYTKWYLPFFMAVERFADVRFLDRPFYQRLPQFLLHFAEKERENHPFGDGYWCGSEDPEWKGFFAQNPFRLYAERFGPEEARIKAEQYAAPELFELHLLDVFLPEGRMPERGLTLDVFLPEGRMPERGLTGEACAMAVFEGAGLASCQTNVADQAHGTGLLVRASRFGSVSHQHADQGSFALIRNNKVLITPSGYFGRCWGTKHHRNWVRASRFGSVSHQHADQGSFALIRNNKVLITPSGYFGRCWGTKHHRNWTKTTKAHNCILVNGRGQETDSFRAAGRFTDWKHEENKRFFLRLDLREAYPMLEFYERSFELTEKELVIRDEIRSKEACEISWLLHMLDRPALQEDGTLVLEHGGERAVVFPDKAFCGTPDITGRFGTSWLLHMLDRPALQEDGTLVLEHGGERAVVFPDKAFCGTPDITGRFGTDVNEGVEEAFRVSMEDQYHVTFITQKKKQHYIEVKICIV